MSALLALSRLIDRLSERVGHTLYWLVLAAVLISAANAVVRKAFNVSSNSFLEIQWYLFSAVFLGCAGYTLLRNEHVRIDVIAGSCRSAHRPGSTSSAPSSSCCRWRLLMMWLSWPVFIEAYARQEVSTNAGGLIIWPARLLVPIGFFLLALQGLSELIKRIAFLMGLIPDPSEKHWSSRPPRNSSLKTSCARAASRRWHRKPSNRPRAVANERFPDRQHRAADVRVAGGGRCCSAIRSRSALAAVGIAYALLGIELGLLPAQLTAGAARAGVGRHVQRHAARGAVLYVHGPHTGT